jgi:CDP-diglyceride synthetase
MAGVPFAQVQVEAGLFGVVKVRWRDWPSRSWLSFVIGGVFVVLGVLFVWVTHIEPVAPPGWYSSVRLIFVVALFAVVGFRLVLEGTVSKPAPGAPPTWDRKLADPWWTSIHTFTGITLGVWLTPWLVVAILTMAWEFLEICVPGFGDEEISGNRLVDIGVAWGGWLVTALIIGALVDTGIPLL